MKSEDGRAPQGKPSSTMFGDVDLEEAHRNTGTGKQGSRNALCASPRIPLGSTRSGSPGGKPASKILKKIKIYTNANNTTVLRPTFPNLRQSSTVHCSTCARSPYY